MCFSRKCPYSSYGGFFGLNPLTALEIPVLISFVPSFKIFGVKHSLPLGISNDPP